MQQNLIVLITVFICSAYNGGIKTLSFSALSRIIQGL